MVDCYASHWPFKKNLFIAHICCLAAADHTRAVEDHLCSLYRAGLSDLWGPSGLLDLYDLLHPAAACLLSLALDSHAFVTGQVAALVYHRQWVCSFGSEVLEGLVEAAGPALIHIASMAEGRRAAALE